MFLSMIKRMSSRRFHGVVGLAAFALLGVAFYMEYQMGLEPCPLCMLQRIVFFFIGLVSIFSALTANEKRRQWFSVTVVVLSLMGAALSIRHLYLQHLPVDDLPACMPGLSYMISAFPWQSVARAMIMGTGDCGEVVWTFLGVSIPGWTLVMFALMAIVNVWIAFRSGKQDVKH
ncbi:Disulfide bond formation protein B [Marinomonas spartinae]|uniref:disulfide bond formation protein B n=1 Tax=Marinomonas spartinae TaxID=1792290 RepID=UPI000808CC28|nr:disulfide bond formation protein B [Marinomonas spartinae]SBS40398.1 Disulfide bond formation protein B [Marinomonas spartinae]